MNPVHKHGDVVRVNGRLAKVIEPQRKYGQDGAKIDYCDGGAYARWVPLHIVTTVEVAELTDEQRQRFGVRS